jgi:hypothetical protein
MPHRTTDDGFHQPPGTRHYNIQFTGAALWKRVTARYFEDMKPEQIEWVWMVEARRCVTLGEIRTLCAGKKAI